MRYIIILLRKLRIQSFRCVVSNHMMINGKISIKRLHSRYKAIGIEWYSVPSTRYIGHENYLSIYLWIFAKQWAMIV